MSPVVVTEDKVRLIVQTEITTYENGVGSVRHEQNLNEFKGIAAFLNQQRGSLNTLKVIGAILAFATSAILGILMYLVVSRPAGHSAISQAPATTLSQNAGNR